MAVAWPVRGLPALAAAALGMLTAGVALVGALAGAADVGVSGSAAESNADVEPSTTATAQIPAGVLRLYVQAARRYDIDWSVLAAIGKVECDHGRDPDPSCSREGAVNAAGAGGPMQFLASTWAQYGVDGDGDGRVDRWDSADAIYSAANYLHASGAPRDYGAAIYAYNHAASYVSEVELWASRYRGTGHSTDGTVPLGAGAGEQRSAPATGGGEADEDLATETATPVAFIPGERAKLSPSNGHVALIPVGVPYVVQALIVAGNELQALSYGAGGHPDPRGAAEEDCSSTLNYVFYRAGVRPIKEILADNPLAQDYVSWGAPGPGRWVTVYATTSPTDHVFVTIAGLRLDTSHDGTDVGPNRDEAGPRWRVLDHIPTWAHWSVRHPPGL